jgi:RNA polymerase sigma-70 factor (ECF subfamily)
MSNPQRPPRRTSGHARLPAGLVILVSGGSRSGGPDDRGVAVLISRPILPQPLRRARFVSVSRAAYIAACPTLAAVKMFETAPAGAVTVSPGAEADSALVARMAGGEERALGALYDRYGRTLFALAYRILADRDDAEEVVLEAFTQAWRNAGSYATDRGSVAAWLVVLARSRALDRLRSRERHVRALERAAGSTPDEGAPAMGRPEPEASHAAEDAERRSRVLGVLQELPEAQRVCIQLAYYDGLTQVEIAARLAEPLGTVKTRMRLGMIKLQEMLRPLMAELSA